MREGRNFLSISMQPRERKWLSETRTFARWQLALFSHIVLKFTQSTKIQLSIYSHSGTLEEFIEFSKPQISPYFLVSIFKYPKSLHWAFLCTLKVFFFVFFWSGKKLEFFEFTMKLVGSKFSGSCEDCVSQRKIRWKLNVQFSRITTKFFRSAFNWNQHQRGENSTVFSCFDKSSSSHLLKLMKDCSSVELVEMQKRRENADCSRYVLNYVSCRGWLTCWFNFKFLFSLCAFAVAIFVG